MERGIVLADVGLYAWPDGIDVEQVDHLDLVKNVYRRGGTSESLLIELSDKLQQMRSIEDTIGIKITPSL
jgi:hypothetical protein